MVKEVEVASDIVLDPFMEPLYTEGLQIKLQDLQGRRQKSNVIQDTLPMGTYHLLQHCRLAGHLISFSTKVMRLVHGFSHSNISTEGQGEVQQLAASRTLL